MAIYDRGSQSTSAPRWAPGEFSIWKFESGCPATSVCLEHAATPFLRIVQADDESSLRRCAFDYLREATQRAGVLLPDGWLAALEVPALGADASDPASRPPVAWLPIEGRERVDRSGFGSFRYERIGPAGERVDSTAVLLACEWAPQIGWLHSGFGLAVTAHVRLLAPGQFETRITGLWGSLPPEPYRPEGVRTLAFDRVLLDGLRQSQPALRSAIEASVRLEQVSILGVRAARTTLELRGIGRGKGDDVLYQFVAQAIPGKDPNAVEIASVRRVPLVADATPGTARMFPLDPASLDAPGTARHRRPTRSEGALDALRTEERVVTGMNSPLANAGVLVVQSGLVSGDTPGATKLAQLPGAGPPVRSNQFSAVNAYANLSELFRRLSLYGIPTSDCFKVVKTPLKARYRSGVRPGPGKDGQTVNARVAVVGWNPGQIGPAGRTPPAGPAELEVHFALANLSHRARAPWDRTHPSPVEPLGIAADERWAWHEIGHVLIMAAMGELEFRFAHSHGDALAAIACDPKSQATERTARGATFPWVFVPRRHDRCVHNGWSWSGSMHRDLARVPLQDHPRRKGYWSEQILSSSLFRLYRCLGGDTVLRTSGAVDVATRESAAHQAIYLIIRGTGLLPAAWSVTTDDVAGLVKALVDADVGTEVLTVPVSDTSTTRMVERVGGCANKVVKWAFEAQGLSKSPSTAVHDGPSDPPPVDVYIASGRPTNDPFSGDVDYGPGTYVPVSLDWDGTPAWHATPAAIDVQGTQARVTVDNRGTQPAKQVAVRVWWRHWPSTQVTPPLWDRTSPSWNVASSTSAAPQDIPPGVPVTFGPFTGLPGAGRYIVFAEATCADDRANSDPATTFACSRVPVTLAELVSCDNNLGVRVIE